MKRRKTSFIYSGRKRFCRKMDIHIIIIIIGRESNLSFLPDSQIYLYYFLHLWPFNRTPPIWWCSRRFFAHHKLDIKNVSAIKGKTSQEARGIMVPHWWFQAFKVSVFSFFKTFLTCIRLVHFVENFSRGTHNFPNPTKYQIFFRLLH